MHQHTYHCTQHDSGTNASIKNKGVQTPEGLHVMWHGMFILKSTRTGVKQMTYNTRSRKESEVIELESTTMMTIFDADTTTLTFT